MYFIHYNCIPKMRWCKRDEIERYGKGDANVLLGVIFKTKDEINPVQLSKQCHINNA